MLQSCSILRENRSKESQELKQHEQMERKKKVAFQIPFAELQQMTSGLFYEK